MPKQKNFLARLFGRKEPKTNPCPDICVDGSWWHQEKKDGICVPVGGPFGKCGDDMNEPNTGLAANLDQPGGKKTESGKQSASDKSTDPEDVA